MGKKEEILYENKQQLFTPMTSLWAWRQSLVARTMISLSSVGLTMGLVYKVQVVSYALYKDRERLPKIPNPKSMGHISRKLKIHFYSHSCPSFTPNPLPEGSRKWNCWSKRMCAKPLFQHEKNILLHSNLTNLYNPTAMFVFFSLWIGSILSSTVHLRLSLEKTGE